MYTPLITRHCLRAATFFLFVISALIVFGAPSTGCASSTTSEQGFTAVADKAIPAVVSIRTKIPQSPHSSPFHQMDPFQDDVFQFFFGHPRRELKQREIPPKVGQGSGFIISADGYILTNGHVVNDASEIRVQLTDGRDFEAKVIGQDSNTDVALIKVDAQHLPHLSLGDSSKLKVGQWAIAIGNPLGLQASLTVGVVSATGRANLDIADLEDFIQTDAAINRGNSGGPLLDISGEVIGMNTAIASSTGGHMGIGFAIPSDMLHHIMGQLKNSGKVTRGFLGVRLQPVDYELAQVFNLKKVEGALIAEVQEGSAGDQGGLKRGDIVLEFNGRRVESVAALRSAVSLTKPGGKIALKVLRDGQEFIVHISVGDHPEGEKTFKTSEAPLGLKVEDLSTNEARKLGLPHDQLGVIVTEVEGEPAASSGIKKGAVILEVNRQRVTSAQQFGNIVQSISSGQRALILITQDGGTAYVVLTMP